MRHCSRSGVLSCMVVAFALLAWLLAFTPAARAQGGVSQIVLEDPTSEPAAPTCQAPATYVLSSSMPSVWTLAEVVPGGGTASVGTFIAVDAEVVVRNITTDYNGVLIDCTWTLALGVIALDGQTPADAGILIAEVTIHDPEGPIDRTFGTVLPPGGVSDAIQAIRNAAGVEIEGEEGENISLGSSCSCPACPLGGRFWVPFTVIGVGRVPGGQQCCATACQIACSRLHQGMSEAEAWLIGQGTWVACMLCQ